MTAKPCTIYSIDGDDKLSFMNDEWDRFALANDTPALRSERVIAQSIWTFVSDDTTRQIYRDMFKVIRAGRRVHFPLRCDSPACRRFLAIDAGPTENAGIEFRVATLAVETRLPQALLAAETPRSQELVRMCAWCKRIAVGPAWVEIEAAIDSLGLFNLPRLPDLTHGICPACDERMARALDDAEDA